MLEGMRNTQGRDGGARASGEGLAFFPSSEEPDISCQMLDWCTCVGLRWTSPPLVYSCRSVMSIT